MTSPREGSNGTPQRILDRFFRPFNGNARPRLANSEITRPAVLLFRCANSLAACNTSSSISNVVLMHLMLMHHPINVKDKKGTGS
jgi:hypothetical protein